MGNGRDAVDAKVGVRAGVGSIEDQSRFGGFLQPRLDLGADPLGRIFGVASLTGATGENADMHAVTLRNAGAGDLDQLYAGWSSGRLLGGLGEDALSLSFGRQGARIDDGVISWGAMPDSCDAACQLQSSAGHFQSTVLTLDASPAHGDLFYAKGDHDQGRSELVGMDAKLSANSGASLAGRYLRLIDPGDRLPLTDIGGYGRVEFGYSLEALLPWSPTLLYGYSFLSGNRPAGGGSDEGSYLPLFEVSEGWNAHFSSGPGGAALAFDSGRAHDVQLKLTPVERLSVGAMYVLCECSRLAHAMDLYANWAPNDRVSLSVGAGVAMAGLADATTVDADSVDATVQASLNISF